MSTTTVSRDQVVQVATALCSHYGMTFTDAQWAAGQPTITEGAHEESPADWLLCWEESPDPDWHQEVAFTVTREATGGAVWAEAVNHWAIAFYPA